MEINPIAKAYKSAWEKFEATSKSIGADAVVGVRIELQNMNSAVVGRLMIYGTAVKFKNPEEKNKNEIEQNGRSGIPSLEKEMESL